jgi:hypothetical protein
MQSEEEKEKHVRKLRPFPKEKENFKPKIQFSGPV